MPDQRPLVTQPFPPQPETVDELLETGLLNFWYLVARAEAVTDKPVALTRLARNLVLWRGEDGALNAVEDYCPHRGAPLSKGQVVGGHIVCPYHGVALDGAGVVVDVPPTPSCPLVGQKALKSYPVIEFNEAIWVYFGDAAHETPPEPAFPEDLRAPDWTGFLVTEEWQCNWQVALDNRTDPVHGSFLHTGTFTLGRGRKDTELQIERTEQGFQTSRSNQRGINIDWHEVRFIPGNMFWVRTEIPYPAAFGGGSFFIDGHITPIDRMRTLFWVYRSRRLTGWRRDMWRFLYKNRLKARNDFVINQDREVLEAIPLAARQREFLLQTDTAVARMRRLLREEATRQLHTASASGSAAE